MNTVRYEILFRGRVQGVGFRWTAMQLAQSYGLTGWVENLDDMDSVLCQVQGSEIAIRSFLSKLDSNDRWIRIDSMEKKMIPLEHHEHSFSVRGY
ncbi:MAG: acylphosphatase [Bulleidia sp.]|nr:acylphosphatase [Bulleidia sp.]